jgi:predicted molibdopterin-dependent oxidoreductase YjgC
MVTEALASLDFLVVQDMFLTETAKLASLVLPATSFAEKEGTFTNFEGRVNRLCEAIKPVGESLPDWRIIVLLADKMKHPLSFSTLQQVMDEIEELVPLYEGYFNSERLYQAEPGIWEAGGTYGRGFLKGFARFSTVDYSPQVMPANGDYPFSLLSGTIPNHFGTGARSSRAWRLHRFSPQAFVEIGDSDAQRLGVSDGDEVTIISPAGEVTTAVKITDTLPQGTLFMPISFPEASPNRLFGVAPDPEARPFSLKACNVRIERAGLHG